MNMTGQPHQRDENSSNQPAQTFYRPELDVLRFAAFALVFLHHILPREVSVYERYFSATLSAAMCSVTELFGFGLSLFFFLSAFLITELLVREKQKTGTLDIRKFYIRRVLRIWPLYFFGIGVCLMLALLAGSGNRLIDFPSTTLLAMFSTMIGNWYVAGGVADAWPKNPITPLWSISIEEQFYLFWPTIVLLFNRRGVFGACFVMLLLAVAAEMYLGSRHADAGTVIWANSFVQLEAFAAGAALALVANGRTPELRRSVRALLVFAAFGAWFVSAFVLKAKYDGPAMSGGAIILGYLLITSGCAALMWAAMGIRKPPSLLIYLGRISFGLYVFHMVSIYSIELAADCFFNGAIGIGVLPKLLIGLPMTILLASLSYRFLETPFLKLKDRYTVVASRPI